MLVKSFFYAVKTFVLNEEIVDDIRSAIKYARRADHRVMLVLFGENDGNLVAAAAEAINIFLRFSEIRAEGILYMYHAFYEDGVSRKELFEKLVKDRETVTYIPYHESEKVLGRTFDAAVVDLINNLEPNDIGRVSGVVAGGGLYVLMMPSPQRLNKMVTRFQSMLLTPQYGAEHLRRLFEERFIRKLFQFDGIAIYDVDNRKVLKYTNCPKAVAKVRKIKVEVPQNRKFPDEVYNLAVTQDQVEVLRLLERFYEKVGEGEKLVAVITADRGRGKSAAVGLALAALAHKLRRAKGRCRIIVTAPNELNAQVLFRFAKLGLTNLGHKVEAIEEKGYVTGLKSRGIEIKYFSPLEAVTKRADILAVDEAASLQVPMLFALLRRHSKVIYSSTIHGYEGAGRGFSVRFLRRLKQLRNVEILQYEMSEPIRYSAGDPVERWAFDTLLLDAEPAPITEEDHKLVEEKRVTYWAPDPESFFLVDEKSLREYFGIYIMAHYRNNPNDLGMIMDAPHHRARALKLENGKIVVSIELAEEGPLDEELAKQCARGAWIMGNIIPDRLIKYYKLIDFGRFKGFRIVRIATHPDLWGKGLGSLALKEIENEAVKEGYDWVGAGFGVTLELLNFWLKNGYVPLHLSPERNPVSGEYSALVVKPLNEKVATYVSTMAMEFKRRLLLSLAEPYHDLGPRIVRALLRSTPSVDVTWNLTPHQIGRLISYAQGDMTLENCMDCMVELARVYFMKGFNFLSEEQELLLITKVLQAKSWRVTCAELGMTPPRAIELLRGAARAMCTEMLGLRTEEDSQKYIFLKLSD
ncbi:MAG: GNAT family N-acetyltransferase [Thermofilaceae archaeon]